MDINYKEKLIKLIKEKSSQDAKPLFLVIRGSHAYGTNIPTSDIDFGGVFIQSLDDILGNRYTPQINDDKNDIVIYEIRRFLELVSSNNPNILELLNTPKDCVLYKDPIFDIILNKSDEFITKICANSFGGYAKTQIQKAKGQNKKQNWEKDKVIRKNPLDFCYLHQNEHSVELTSYLNKNGLDQKYCGLSKQPHSRDTYAIFYDFDSQSKGLERSTIFKGISFEDSNDIKLSSIPENIEKEFFIGHISYNKDGYTQHCNDYRSYEIWLQERNESRWVDVKSHGQKIDGKNMMHCKRLIQMAREIAEGKGIVVRRPNASELISIRKGEVDLQTLIDSVESEIVEIDRLFKISNLPESIDGELINNILVSVRKQVYSI